MRKRTERDRKKLEMEALQTPSTSPQQQPGHLVNQVRSNTGQLNKEKYLLKSLGKRREVPLEITNKFRVRFDFKAKRGKKKDELTDE